MKKPLCCALAFALLLGLAPVSAKAADKLDEIQNYQITVDMRSDATMDMTYHIEWKVLDDSSEGPLTWVKIGVANSHVDEIQALSDSIADIYYSGDDGDYVRIDLDQTYYAGDVVTLDFSLHQSYMYRVDTDNEICSFYFTPGWFDGIDVKSMTVLWNDENVLHCDSSEKQGNYHYWSTSLSAGERTSVYLEYSLDAFDTDYAEPYEEGYQESGGTTNDDGGGLAVAIMAIVFIGILVVAAITSKRRGGGGGYHGGFGTRVYYGGGGHCACASSCACACACACAGGGRAGCSAKNFYGAAQLEQLEYALKKHAEIETRQTK